ncbi:hypothetical protein CFIMG_001342RA [Ceratocystis fimbriata CBS 114723]|uniref:FAD/NAD(P)-binding domain-containing protein n=1 Tax=Ceratocystis fimbriata CBS 114723 TaxID=1035309 RepID=A0A2C5XBW2_9PEZI|nr:hypothetical protein CFIMG_001342RA [Ceratocystis fimbriata CBS 114723]
MVKTVVVVGASYAGLAVSHRLLKYTRQQSPDLKVVLVSKSSQFYWNIAAIRAVVPEAIRDDQLFHPIEPGFASYPSANFQFLVGTASSIDDSAKTASIQTSTGTQKISYDYLVLASGARAATSDIETPWKAVATGPDDKDNYSQTLAALHATQKRVAAAKHIVIAGAGPTGVETSAELRYAHKDKTVVLLTAGDTLLSGDSIGSTAEREITSLGVQIQRNARVTNTRSLANGKTEVVLESGETIETDLYLPTMGLAPNSEYLPAKSLNENKYVNVDENFQVQGLRDAWACGDIVSKPRAGFMLADKQAAGVAKNVELALQGKSQLAVKGFPFDVMIGAAGRDRGFVRAGWIGLPSILAWAAKSRTLGLDSAPKYVNGSQW